MRDKRDFPMTFDEFVKRFSTEEQCRDYLFQLRRPDGFECPHCGGKEYGIIGDKLYWCTKCKYKVSVTSGTIFQDTRSPLKTWFTAIWWITAQKYGASAEGLQQILGLSSYETAWTWLHKIRKAMVRSDRSKLTGTAEADETYIGGEEHSSSTGRGAGNKVLVAIAVELRETGKSSKPGLKKPGRVRLSVIPDASTESIMPFVTDNIEKGSEVITDGCSSYSFLAKNGYKHTIYVQSRKKADEKILPHVHLIISLLKRWLLGTHQGAVSDKHIQAYLEEYTFRFNRRDSAKRGLLFQRLLEGAVDCAPLTYDDLVNVPDDF
jgi:transposase-like protein/ribosomal protein L37AE/L43A